MTPDAGAAERNRILIVDDHPIVVLGLKLVIEQHADFEVCGTAETLHYALAMMGGASPPWEKRMAAKTARLAIAPR